MGESAWKPDACCTKCLLLSPHNLQAPFPEDYDKNGVAYVLPPDAEPLKTPPMGRVKNRGAYICCKRVNMPVPDYADRTKMYPQFHPQRQTMVDGSGSRAEGQS